MTDRVGRQCANGPCLWREGGETSRPPELLSARRPHRAFPLVERQRGPNPGCCISRWVDVVKAGGWGEGGGGGRIFCGRIEAPPPGLPAPVCLRGGRGCAVSPPGCWRRARGAGPWREGEGDESQRSWHIFFVLFCWGVGGGGSSGGMIRALSAGREGLSATQ